MPMCVYCSAASRMLDLLWDDDGLRDHFHAQGYDLSALGKLTHEVFVPAYRKIKDGLDPAGLRMLEAQLTQDMLQPFYDRPGFRQVWEEWDQPTRDAFIQEQSEVQLAELLVKFFSDEFADAYKAAFDAYAGELS